MVVASDIHQLFLSYTHIDNEIVDDGRKGWVDCIFEGLEYELRFRAIKASVWRDTRDHKKDQFIDDDILSAVENSKIMLSVLSPSYPERPYCVKEVNHFCTHVNNDKKNRLIKIVRRPVEDEAVLKTLPESMCRTTGFEFYSKDKQTNRIVAFVNPDGSVVRKQEYWDRIQELGDAIDRQLSGIPPEKQHSENETTVYLAEAAYAERLDRDSVRAELVSRGYMVLPHSNLPSDERDAIRQIDADLAISDYSIHLLGSKAGFIPEGLSMQPIVQLQLSRAEKRAQSAPEFRRFIWCRSHIDLKTADDQQLRTIYDLQSGRGLITGDEFVREPLELFKNALFDHLTMSSDSNSSEDAKLDGSVLIVHHSDDADHYFKLRRELFNKGHEVFRIVLEDGAKRDLPAEESFLRKCGTLIVLFGNVTDNWVQQELLRAVDRDAKLSIDGRSKIVALVGEPSDVKSHFLTRLADETFDLIDHSNEEALGMISDLIFERS